jgi:DNA-binding response OmpR family regulator
MDYEGYDRTIDAHIKNLRQKMTSSKMTCGCQIETIRGVGYKLEVDADAH